MTVDLGLEELLKNEKKSNDDAKKSSNSFVIPEKNAKNFIDLYQQKKFSEIKFIVEKNLIEFQDENSSKWVLSKIWQLVVNIEEEEIPSVVLVAPFGELCGKIKNLKDVGTQEFDEIIYGGRILFNDFMTILSKTNESSLQKMLMQYASLFKLKDRESIEEEQENERRVTKIEEQLVSDMMTTNRFIQKRKRLIISVFTVLILVSAFIITSNHFLNLKKSLDAPDALFFDKIEIAFPIDQDENFKLEHKSSIDDKEALKVNFDSMNVLADKVLDKNKKIKKKNVFRKGTYKVLRATQVKMNPYSEARDIGVLDEGNRIKVVGKIAPYYQISSKDGSVNGYVLIKDCKFLK